VIGRFAGGVYRPALDTVPTVLLPPGMPLTCQLTAWFAVLVSAAAKDWLPSPACTVALLGDTATVIGSVGVNRAQAGVRPALAGAEVVAAVALTTTCALSVLPA
jgi:hypothetical protein